jgi:hypothetical protein
MKILLFSTNRITTIASEHYSDNHGVPTIVAMETNKQAATQPPRSQRRVAPHGVEHPEVADIEINPLRMNSVGALALYALVALEQDKT